MSTGTIYVIGSQPVDIVKIGYTDGTAQARLAQLQTGNPALLEVLHSLSGELWLEQELHLVFAPHRLQGEWFSLGSDAVQRVTDAAALALWVGSQAVLEARRELRRTAGARRRARRQQSAGKSRFEQAQRELRQLVATCHRTEFDEGLIDAAELHSRLHPLEIDPDEVYV